MPSVSRTGGVSPTVSVSYPAPGTVNKGSGVSNGGTAAATFHLLTEAGDPLTTESGDRLVTENAP